MAEDQPAQVQDDNQMTPGVMVAPGASTKAPSSFTQMVVAAQRRSAAQENSVPDAPQENFSTATPQEFEQQAPASRPNPAATEDPQSAVFVEDAAPSAPIAQSMPASVPSAFASAPLSKPGSMSSDEMLAAAGSISLEELEELRANEASFSWQASEYVHHHKGASWYAGLMGGVLVLVIISALLRFWTTLVAFLVMGGAIIVYAVKPPRVLLYELSPSGITIDGRHFPFSEFRSFGVLPDTEWHTIDLEPKKRFSPRISVLFDDDDFEDIVGHLELHLPRIDSRPDIIERLSRYLRF